MTDFDKAFNIVIGHEGGYVNDPRDPGGETKFGISKRAYPEVDIAGLTLEDAKRIYHADYWEPCRCDEYTWPLSLYVFDGAVNQGVVATRKMLQSALGVKADGILGKNTMAAARDASEWHVNRFMAKRALRYFGTRNFDRFGEGWLIRTYGVARQGEQT